MADVNILVDVAVKKAIKDLNGLEKEFNDLDKSAKKSGKDVDKSFALISKGAAATAVAVAAVGAAIIESVRQASKLQDLETQFIAFTGSAESAADQVERIAEFSGQTPFQLEELVKANRTLLAFGQGTEESLTVLAQLGDVAAGTGADLGELALILGQVEAAGKLSGERFLQFAERGINLAPILAEQLGVAETQIAELRKQGKISADDVKKAFETMTAEGGKFENSMDRLSKTFSGATSTLSDNIDLLAADLGKLLLPIATDVTIGLTKAAQAVRSFLNDSKPEQIRGLVSELKTLEQRLKNVDTASKLEGFFGFDEAADKNKEKASQLRQEIEALKNTIVNVSTGTVIGPQLPGGDESPVKAEPLDQELISAQQKIDDELLALSQQAAANRNAVAQTENEDAIDLLDERFASINDKIIEQQTSRLQLLSEFDEAEKLQVQAKLDAIAKAEKEKDDADRARAKKARDDEFNFEKIKLKAIEKFDKQTYSQRVQTAQKGLAALASLQRTGSKEAFEIGKAASIAQALVAIPTTAIEAYKSLAGIPIVGPGLGAVAAAAAVAAGTAQVNQIRSQQFTGFQDGGLVEGGIPGRDSVPILAQQGEVVVPRKNFEQLNFNNDGQLKLLSDIKELLMQAQSSNDDIEELELPPISVELTLNGEVLANQILELNRDNQRIA